MKKDVKSLYRKVNTNTQHVHHNTGSDAKYDRNTKSGLNKNMKKDVQRGLDYTPLYMYLLSKIGQDWDKIHSDAIKRLDKEEPIYHLVAKNDTEKRDYVNCGESSHYSGLYIDENNTLQKVNPNLKNEDLIPSCPCCTHTFNGKVLVKKHNYADDKSIRV
jgi:hypothetical protein